MSSAPPAPRTPSAPWWRGWGLRRDRLEVPRPAPPRLRRLDLLWRYGLAVLGQLAALVATLVGGVNEHWGMAHLVTAATVSCVVGAIAVWIMRWRRRWPLGIALASPLLAVAVASNTFTSIWALASLSTRRRLREVLPAAVVFVVCADLEEFNPLMSSAVSTSASHHVGTLVTAVVEAALLVAVGFYIGARRDLLASLREQVQQAERAQELLVLHAEAQERNRIAREMHDVVAHRISLVAMHAGALSFRSDLPPEQVREIAATIQENATASLTELRSVLGQLRTPGDQGTPALPDKPQPTLADVQALVLDARAAGMVVDFRNDVQYPELLPAQTGRHAYRIVQEAVTNARKHARGARVRIWLGGAPGQGLELRVVNPLRAGTALVPGSGAGLVGVHERAQMVGGRAWAGALRTGPGPGPDDSFEVRVWLPW